MFTEFALHQKLLQALDKRQLLTPTPVQQAVLPLALAGRDLQVSAETGSGKTVAYLLPCLDRLLSSKALGSATRCLVLVPTRELATQVLEECRSLAAFTSLRAETVLGGMPFKEQKAMIRRNPEILVATPGRLRDHLNQGSVLLEDLECLVLDEADRMLDMGFREDVMTIVNACGKQRQVMLLSATLRHDGLGRVASEILNDPAVVDLSSARDQPAGIRQQVILADDPAHKERLCVWLLANETRDKVLVFTNTREHADQLAARLRQQGQRTASLHGEMTQEERVRVMNLFRSKKLDILVATDLAARGLDIPEVSLVINFAMARSGDEYVHRIGRTGRAGKEGLAISLIGPQEWNLMESIQRYLGVSFESRKIEAMPARFQGPRKRPKAGAKGKRKSHDEKNKRTTVDKSKERHRVKKNIGKRRQPTANSSAAEVAGSADGLAPLARRKRES